MTTFELDKNGNLILKPMTGWEMSHFQGVVMIVGIDYADSQEELERMSSRRIAFSVSPALALEFAEAMKREASKLLGQTSPGDRPVQ
jgi:hypothetical protein